jgi:hypothetical protein
MKENARILSLAGLLALWSAGAASAAIEPVTAVQVGKSRWPPYMLQSITVGDYVVTREFLATGSSTGKTVLNTTIRSADDFDLNSVASRSGSGIWRVTNIGGQPLWQDTNGERPDFFVFEAGMNDALTVQAILPGGALGQPVSIARCAWGNTGLKRLGLANLLQPIGGFSFAVTDLLDPEGVPLSGRAVIVGIQFNSGNVDPTGFYAVVPEPATVAILGLGSLLVIRHRHLRRVLQ